MKISSTMLGIIAMLASPFLLGELYILGNKDQNTSFGGVCDLIYMLGWSCSIIGLLRLNATGEKSGRIILFIQLALLGVANIWNIWTIADPGNSSLLYFILDFFWPLSNIWLLVTGIVIAIKGRLQGWKRYAPLMAGSWLPVSILVSIIFGRTEAVFLFSGIYSAITWFIMGFSIYNSSQSNSPSIQAMPVLSRKEAQN